MIKTMRLRAAVQCQRKLVEEGRIRKERVMDLIDDMLIKLSVYEIKTFIYYI